MIKNLQLSYFLLSSFFFCYGTPDYTNTKSFEQRLQCEVDQFHFADACCLLNNKDNPPLNDFFLVLLAQKVITKGHSTFGGQTLLRTIQSMVPSKAVVAIDGFIERKERDCKEYREVKDRLIQSAREGNITLALELLSRDVGNFAFGEAVIRASESGHASFVSALLDSNYSIDHAYYCALKKGMADNVITDPGVIAILKLKLPGF